MNIKMNRNVGRILLTGACAAALTVGAAAPAFAVEQTGTTNVTYSSSQQVPGTNGWGFEIPTSIPFGPDKAVGVDATVNLYNTTPGGSVDQIPDQDFPNAGVKLALKSANGFKLQKSTAPLDPVAYEIAYTGTGVTTQKFDTTTGTAKTDIGTFTKTNSTAVGVAKRTGDAAESGSHTDTLTFSYDDAKTPLP
ncbi:hypothetical protein [Eggerthella guodeyinii]|uniref:WxL domain-containing protein n=1 Tax=Eggerthella guodeyinii TaxID=2690837 RepID=A0A6N7RNX1_9ACTN|nr:hypothetical protein [Eggerthella guodeyinii]MRX82677.1 hypothetical protein [Eggerthella guodeyinii]